MKKKLFSTAFLAFGLLFAGDFLTFKLGDTKEITDKKITALIIQKKLIKKADKDSKNHLFFNFNTLVDTFELAYNFENSKLAVIELIANCSGDSEIDRNKFYSLKNLYDEKYGEKQKSIFDEEKIGNVVILGKKKIVFFFRDSYYGVAYIDVSEEYNKKQEDLNNI